MVDRNRDKEKERGVVVVAESIVEIQTVLVAARVL